MAVIGLISARWGGKSGILSNVELTTEPSNVEVMPRDLNKLFARMQEAKEKLKEEVKKRDGLIARGERIEAAIIRRIEAVDRRHNDIAAQLTRLQSEWASFSAECGMETTVMATIPGGTDAQG